MTWYYVPSGSLASVPAQEVSTSECMTLWADALAASYTWNTKPLPAKSWLRVLRTVPWMTRRFGVTFTPLMLADGAARWMGSLGDTPASRFPLLGSGSESMTRGTSGRQSRESSLSASQVGASSKMWLDTFGSDTGTLFAQTSNALATGSRKASSRRRKSAPPTSGNGSSSWPTARAKEDGEYTRDGGEKGRERLSLTGLAQNWPTPRSEDSESAGNHPGATDSLTGATAMWPTPRSITGGGESAERKQELGRTESGGGDLQATAEHWATPAARSVKGGYSEEALTRNDGKSRMDILDNQAIYFQPSHPDPETVTHGSESSPSAPTSRRQLNPKFVCWLMGWTPGWTSLEPLSSASPATASCPPKPATPSAPSGDNWPTPDTQNARSGSMRAEAKGKHAMSLHHVVEGWQGPAGAEWMHTVGFGNLEDVAE